MDALPSHYFRLRENGAAVYRLDTENRQNRIEMEQIAVVNLRNGEVKPQGGRTLTAEDAAAIEAWKAERAELTARREIDDIRRTVDQMNLAAQWAQSKATDEDLDTLTGPLLLAMHDLRGVLTRRRADRLTKRK